MQSTGEMGPYWGNGFLAGPGSLDLENTCEQSNRLFPERAPLDFANWPLKIASSGDEAGLCAGAERPLDTTTAPLHLDEEPPMTAALAEPTELSRKPPRVRTPAPRGPRPAGPTAGSRGPVTPEGKARSRRNGLPPFQGSKRAGSRVPQGIVAIVQVSGAADLGISDLARTDQRHELQ